MAHITRESLLANIKRYNQDLDTQLAVVLESILQVLDKETRQGKTAMNIASGAYPLLDVHTYYFKARLEEMGLVYITKMAHPYACDCDKSDPCTKFHVIKLTIELQ